MKFSKSTELAIHGLWLLSKANGNTVLVSDLARAQKVSSSYLAKVFQKLVHSGLVRSIRGKRGGFRLARPAATITVAEVARAIEAEEPLFDCMRLERGCEGIDDCRLHRLFDSAEEALYGVLKETTLSDLQKCSKTKRSAWLRLMRHRGEPDG